ncbi:hypothetical protein niasHS_011126 [Heterodera schachtii]|uniref:F-box/SPRY domain-containing protein 1 n=2 Tax=Heterodera TaxID=34509 RepID=A0ABD2ITK2_HETSC
MLNMQCFASVAFLMDPPCPSETQPTVPKRGHHHRRRVDISASRLPRAVLVRIFGHLSVAELGAVSLVCRSWKFIVDSNDFDLWAHHARAQLPESALSDPYLFVNISSHREMLRAFKHAWNPSDCSRNAFVRTNGFTVHRQPIAQSTDGIRGKVGVSGGAHCWEFCWEGPLGTTAVVGVATKHAALHCPGYLPLIGSDDQSWGWNLVNNTIAHNGEFVERYPRLNNAPKYQIGERVRMVLDHGRGQLYFEKGDEFFGLAFSNLPPVRLFPAICAVYGNTEVTMVYLGPPIVG